MNGAAALRQLARDLRSLKVGTHLTRPISTRLATLTARSYRAQETPEGANWAAGKYTSKPILRKSGRLLGSLTPLASANTAGLKFGARYGWYHQHGATLRGRKPAGPALRRSVSGPLQLMARRRIYSERLQGRERGRLPARRILPVAEAMPKRWEAPTMSLIDRYVMSKILGS